MIRRKRSVLFIIGLCLINLIYGGMEVLGQKDDARELILKIRKLAIEERQVLGSHPFGLGTPLEDIRLTWGIPWDDPDSDHSDFESSPFLSEKYNLIYENINFAAVPDSSEMTSKVVVNVLKSLSPEQQHITESDVLRTLGNPGRRSQYDEVVTDCYNLEKGIFLVFQFQPDDEKPVTYTITDNAVLADLLIDPREDIE